MSSGSPFWGAANEPSSIYIYIYTYIHTQGVALNWAPI